MDLCDLSDLWDKKSGGLGFKYKFGTASKSEAGIKAICLIN